jgi:hypothetical protein
MQDFLGINSDARYCVVAEDQILDALRLCWLFEARGGAEVWADRQAQENLERWRVEGLPCRREGPRRYFDFCQVVNFLTWAGLTHNDPVYWHNALPTTRRVALEFNSKGSTADAPGPGAPARFEIRLRREFNLRGCEPCRVLRLRVPLPLTEQTQSEASVKLVQPCSGEFRTIIAPGRLEVQLPGAVRSESAVVEVRIRFTSSCQAVAVNGQRLQAWDTASPDYQLYTRRSEGLIQVTVPIVSLAESLSRSAPDAWQAVQAFWSFFFERMHFGYIHHDELDAADPLACVVRRGWCDCYTGSALLVALCRARGIPARIVSGLLLTPSMPNDHYWVEVLLPPYGWLPVDLMSWNLAAGKLDQEPWSHFFLGRLDHRMKNQCLPHVMLGKPGIRFPTAWYMLPHYTATGCARSFYSLRTQELLYRDDVQVIPEPAGEGGPS